MASTGRSAFVALAAAATLVLPFLTLGAQPRPTLRLADVLRTTEAQAFLPAAARADAAAARADRTATLQGLLPALRVEGGTVRTTDPIGVFGARLRQRAVTPADFDPARLNRPDALTLTTGALVLEQPILAPQALIGRRAAGLAADAADAMAQHTAQQAQLGAASAYYGAVVARAGVAALDSALTAGRAHVAQATTLERNGVVTRSDMLLAQVRVGDLEAQRAQAAGDAIVARLGLAVQMGQPDDTTAALPAALPSAETITALVQSGWPFAGSAGLRQTVDATAGVAQTLGTPAAVPGRRDVQAARLGARAAQVDVQRAAAGWLPTVGAMLRNDWGTVDQPFGGSPFWTVGVMASWPIFRGGADLADRERATARARAAAERASGAAAQASLEATQARIRRDVALERLAIADRSLVQAQEALRLVQRRYDGGLAAITELLDAAAARTAADLASVAARHDALVALAAERTALGLDLTPLLALDR